MSVPDLVEGVTTWSRQVVMIDWMMARGSGTRRYQYQGLSSAVCDAGCDWISMSTGREYGAAYSERRRAVCEATCER
jgi:hypothetical protein